NQCSPTEIRRLFNYFNVEENEELLKELIQNQHQFDDSSGSIEGFEPLLTNSFKKIKDAITVKNKRTGIASIYKLYWFRIAAAAVVMFLFSASVFYFLHRKEERVIVAKMVPVQTVKDVPPGNNNAILTLANGSTILLDTAANGTLAKQGNIKVFKLDGKIAYNKTADMNAKPVYNTITTANGNQYQLILTDGSKVWLNAASSIRFPTAFTGNERRVQITGEAYFEVAKDPERPFKVDFENKAGNKDEIEVLGTHFNVNTYLDEPDFKTTLLEGSVKIKAGNTTKTISPGQQAIITSNRIEIKRDVDLDHVMAWKNGYFLFDNTDIYTLMRQVARWYNVDIQYNGKITEEEFSGKISRDVPLSKLIKVLELNDVHVRIEGRKLIVGRQIVQNGQ
ncbi:MAG: FecR family protein, partial [Ginsengibacter sp.]